MSFAAKSSSPSAGEPRHWRNVVVLWLIANLIMLPIVIWVIGPGLPPGNGTVESAGQVTDNTVLLSIATPVALGVLVFMAYACWAFRERTPEVVVDGPAIQGNSSVQFWWLVATTVLVLFLAGYGSVRLLADGAGGGQGPNPIATPAGDTTKPLDVQVIAQQWQFTYRWPQYGGIETTAIDLPANTLVRFDVTSLDVIHSFWAYELGVKADANPGIDNVAFVTTRGPLLFHVHCAELCGVWHGYMFDQGRVVPKAQFAAWIAQQRQISPTTNRALGPVQKTYFPQPLRRGG